MMLPWRDLIFVLNMFLGPCFCIPRAISDCNKGFNMSKWPQSRGKQLDGARTRRKFSTQVLDLLGRVNDSKQLAEQQREELYQASHVQKCSNF